MGIDVEMRRKIAVSIISVGAFLTIFVSVGITLGPDIGETGGIIIVGTIVLFVVVMAAVGVLLDG